MGLVEKFYDNSAIFSQNIMVSVSGYQRNTSRYGKTYNEHLNFLVDFDTWPLEKIIDEKASCTCGM
jgi:phenylacetate-CoA ligase